jgi:uncharacterized protein with HEPN domain
MPREPRAYLYDIAQAARLIAEFTEELDLDAYVTPSAKRSLTRQISTSIVYRR